MSDNRTLDIFILEGILRHIKLNLFFFKGDSKRSLVWTGFQRQMKPQPQTPTDSTVSTSIKEI